MSATAKLWLAASLQAQSNVVISFTTSNATPLNISLAGFTTELLGTGVE